MRELLRTKAGERAMNETGHSLVEFRLWYAETVLFQPANAAIKLVNKGLTGLVLGLTSLYAC
jgi:hypothetical protein